MWDVIVLIPALGFFYLFYYALALSVVWLLPIYFDTYIGSSYMIQVLFCLYVYVEEKALPSNSGFGSFDMEDVERLEVNGFSENDMVTGQPRSLELS